MLVTFVSHAKITQPIDTSFGRPSRVGPRTMGTYPSRERDNFFWGGEGEVAPHCKVTGQSTMTCAKMAEPISRSRFGSPMISGLETDCVYSGKSS